VNGWVRAEAHRCLVDIADLQALREAMRRLWNRLRSSVARTERTTVTGMRVDRLGLTNSCLWRMTFDGRLPEAARGCFADAKREERGLARWAASEKPDGRVRVEPGC
jgi:hypothetical protein